MQTHLWYFGGIYLGRCLCCSSLYRDMFNKKFETWYRDQLLRFCVTQDPDAWFKSILLFLDSTSVSPLPQREKRIEHEKSWHTHTVKWMGWGLRETESFLFMSELNFNIFFLVCYILFHLLCSHCTPSVFLLFLQFWELLHGHENFGII